MLIPTKFPLSRERAKEKIKRAIGTTKKALGKIKRALVFTGKGRVVTDFCFFAGKEQWTSFVFAIFSAKNEGILRTQCRYWAPK